MLSTVQTAWVAGLLEGEGTFGLHHGKRPEVGIKMTDLDVIIKYTLMVGISVSAIGVANVRAVREFGDKPAFQVRVRGPKAVALMEQILPFMGERRSAKIKEVMRGRVDGGGTGVLPEVRQ